MAAVDVDAAGVPVSVVRSDIQCRVVRPSAETATAVARAMTDRRARRGR